MHLSIADCIMHLTSGGFAPDPHQGSAPGPRWWTSGRHSDPLGPPYLQTLAMLMSRTSQLLYDIVLAIIPKTSLAAEYAS